MLLAPVPRVLLADDNAHAQRMGAEILGHEGFEVLGVTDGHEVMDSLARFAPDLVLADAAMPQHSGYEICERIKQDPALQHVKVVLLVGAFEPLNQAEAERVRADGVLTKPFDPSAFMETVRPLVGGSAARAAPPAEKPAPAVERPDLEQAVRAALGGEHVDPERIRAAVTLALESALPVFVDQVTERVVEALRRGGR